MFDPVKQRLWRGLTSLIVAYALVIQAFLAWNVAAQQEPGSADTLFVLCAHDGGATSPSGDTDRDAGKPHCPDCTLAALATVLPPQPSPLAMARLALVERLQVQTARLVSFSSPRAGLSRAPPTDV